MFVGEKNDTIHQSIQMSIDRLFAGSVELVPKNGRPFCIIQDSGMRAIIDPIVDGIIKNTGERK